MTNTDICNMALGRIGATRITDYDTDSSIQGVQCRLYYEQTRDALLRSHEWPFASARAELTENASTPDFQWDHQFDLPDDFLRLKTPYDINGDADLDDRWEIEGSLFLTNNDEVEITYIKQVTDPDDFDVLFTEVLVLNLALKLLSPLTGMGTSAMNIRKELSGELKILMSHVRTVNMQEINVTGRSNWVMARHGGTSTV